MTVYRSPEFGDRRNEEHIGNLKGRCQKGIHYGNGCYDLIGIWYVPEREQNRKTAPDPRNVYVV